MAGNWWSTLWGRQEVPPNPEETADRHFWDLFDAPDGTGAQARRVVAADAITAPDDAALPGAPWQGPATGLSPFFPDPTPTLILPPGGLTALPGPAGHRSVEEITLTTGNGSNGDGDGDGDGENSIADGGDAVINSDLRDPTTVDAAAPENPDAAASQLVAPAAQVSTAARPEGIDIEVDLPGLDDADPAPAIESLAVEPPVPADPAEAQDQDQSISPVDLIDDGPQGHPDPVAATTPAAGIPPVRPHPEQNGLTVSQLDTFITELLAIEGATGAAVVDIESGMALAIGGNPGFDLNVAAAGNSNVVRAKLRTMADLNLGGDTKIEDILITLSTQYHLINVLDEGAGSVLFVYLVLNRSTANLALARHRLRAAAGAVKI